VKNIPQSFEEIVSIDIVFKHPFFSIPLTMLWCRAPVASIRDLPGMLHPNLHWPFFLSNWTVNSVTGFTSPFQPAKQGIKA